MSATKDVVKEPRNILAQKLLVLGSSWRATPWQVKSYCGSSVAGRCLTLVVRDFTVKLKNFAHNQMRRAFHGMCHPKTHHHHHLLHLQAHFMQHTTQHSFATDTHHSILLWCQNLVCSGSRDKQKQIGPAAVFSFLKFAPCGPTCLTCPTCSHLLPLAPLGPIWSHTWSHMVPLVPVAPIARR